MFKQPPPLEPPRSSPPPSLRDPPWPVRPLLSDRPSSQNQRKDSSLAPTVPGHRSPRPYNKVASSEYDREGGVGGGVVMMSQLRLSLCVLREGV